MLDVGSSISRECLGLFGLFIAVHHSDLLRTPLCCDEFWCDLVEVDQLLCRDRLKKRCRTSFAWCGNRKKELDLRRLRFETCKMNDIDPSLACRLLARLPDHPANKVADLLPWNRRSARRQSAVAP